MAGMTTRGRGARTAQAVEVDERDSSWEDPEPRFRVYLHDAVDGPGGATQTHDLTGVDVLQAIDWAQRRAGTTHTWAIALVADDAHGRRGLVWLVGADGNESPGDPVTDDAHRRMLLRRDRPVALGPDDAHPEQI